MVLRPLLPLLNYVVNYSYITEVLCINKQRPALLCSGKCYLRREMAKNTDPAPLSKTKITTQKTVEGFIVGDSFMQIDVQCSSIKKYQPPIAIERIYNFSFVGKPFRPPAVA